MKKKIAFVGIDDPELIETYGIKYLGSKKSLLPFIGQVVMDLGVKTALDCFSGTTRVAQYLRQIGIATTTSDLSWATTHYAQTFVHNKDNRHLSEFVKEMNQIAPYRGWLTENYSGIDVNEEREDGRCFQPKNTMKADAARDYIDTLDLEPWEQSTLITSVIRALDSVDNTVGVQQAYLKQWCKRSYNDIRFDLPPCIDGLTSVHLQGDCLKLQYDECDLAYVDPPYSPHSYSTYYHIWDSIAAWDKPKTALKARRRLDRVTKSADYDEGMESPWYRASKSLPAFSTLLSRLPAKHILISYNDESIVAKDDLLDLCLEFGSVSLKEIDYKRNIMCGIGNADKNGDGQVNQKNKELLILITRK